MYLNYIPVSDGRPRILVVRLGAMGDIIHTLPAVADLRAAAPDAQIVWAVDRRWMPILKGNPAIDRAIPVSLSRLRRFWFRRSSWSAAKGLAERLRAMDLDLALDFQGLIKSALIADLSGARCVAGFEPTLLREPPAGLLYNRLAYSSAAHVVDRYRGLAAFATGRPNPGPAVFLLPRGKQSSGLPKRFVLASPQAGWGHKEWPARHFSELASRIWDTHRVPLVADCIPGRERVAEEIRRSAPDGAVIPHPSTLEELIGTTRAAEAVVGVDSGPLHLAAALGKPGIAIFGPTDPGRNGPYGTGMAVIRNPNARTSYRRHREHSDAMEACSPAMVHEALAAILSSSRSRPLPIDSDDGNQD